MPILDKSSCDTYLNGGTGGPSYENVLCIGDGTDSKVKSLLEKKSRYVSFREHALVTLVVLLQYKRKEKQGYDWIDKKCTNLILIDLFAAGHQQDWSQVNI